MPTGQTTYTRQFFTGWQLDPNLSVSQWADAHRILPAVSAKEAGQYRTERTPYLREIMDSLSGGDPATEICVMKGTQVGATEAANNFVGYIIDIAPGPCLFVMPTVDLAKDHSKNRIAPMIEHTPRIREKVANPKSRDSSNTMLSKQFPGGAIYLAGSNSGAGFRSRSIRYLILDDMDGYEMDVDGEGSPIELAIRRTDTYGRRKKIFYNSTPTVQGISQIESIWRDSDQRAYHMPCPHCGHMQALEWGGEDAPHGIKFSRDDGGTVIDCWYVCAKCHGRIDEQHKTAMLAAGVWVAAYPDRERKGYHISGLLSPSGFVSWKQIATEFLQAKTDPQRLKVWVNTRLGLPFEEKGSQPDWVELKNRCEQYAMLTIPTGGLMLSAGVDVQDDRLAVVIRAWGRGEESWLIYHTEIYGDTAQDDVWNQLRQLLQRPFPTARGTQLNVISCGIDSGGHRTQEVYNFCRMNAPICFALKGSATAGKPVISRPTDVDVTWYGKVIPKAVQLWPIGTDTAKAMIYARVAISEPGPGCYHWYIGADDEYFMQLCAEKLVTRFIKGYPRQEWHNVRPGGRNEAIDCEVYALAAAVRAGMARMDWDAIERAPKPKPKTEQPQQPRRPGFIGGFNRPSRGGWLDR